MTSPSPSATVMLLRDSAKGIEALLVRRNARLATGAGAWVFPGGRVDAQDYSADDHFLAAQNAAIRETFEETGVAINREQLIPFAHWTTPPGRARRFATWFFVAHLRESCEIRVDGNEIVDYRWYSPQAALRAQQTGEISLMAPTFVSLTLASAFPRCADALAEFSQREVQHFNPRICHTETGQIILYDDDAGYASRDPGAPGRRHRVTMVDTCWRYENSEQSYPTDDPQGGS